LARQNIPFLFSSTHIIDKNWFLWIQHFIKKTQNKNKNILEERDKMRNRKRK
jgi:hypothetical protein